MELQAFSSRELRNVLGAFATGVTVITSQGPAHPYGMTANAFSSVSLDPPLILVCVSSGTEGCKTIMENKVFAVNILSADQEPISRYFASRDRPRGWEAFSEIAYHTVVTGSPILQHNAAYLDCQLATHYEAGDHTIFIGEVLALGVDPNVQPLIFHHGRYARLCAE